MNYLKYIAVAILAYLAMLEPAMAAQPLSSSGCVVINKTLISSNNPAPVQKLVIAPHISAYGIPKGGATLSDEPVFLMWTNPYLFALTGISPTDSRAMARLEVTWRTYTYSEYEAWLKCSRSLIKATLADVSLGAPANYTWSTKGNLADVVNAIPFYWGLDIPAPYSALPTDYYDAPDAGLGITFTLNFTEPTVLSGLRAGDINKGRYGVSVPISSSDVALVVGDYAKVAAPFNPFKSWATGGMTAGARSPTEYVATGFWSYNKGFPSGVGPDKPGLAVVWFEGAIVPPDWGYVAYLTVPQAPSVRSFLRQFILVYDNYTGNIAIYDWPSGYVPALNCGSPGFLGSSLGSASVKYFAWAPNPLAAATSYILSGHSWWRLPGYGPFALQLDCAYPVAPRSPEWQFWYTLYAYYMAPVPARWEVYISDVSTGDFSNPIVYVVQPAGGIADVKVYVWGSDIVGQVYGPGGVSPDGNPNDVTYVYGVFVNRSLWSAVTEPQRNPYYWLAWPSVSAGSAYFDDRLSLELGYPGAGIVEYVQPLYIWDWPAPGFSPPYALLPHDNPFSYSYGPPSSIGLAEQTNRAGFEPWWAVMPLEYAWFSQFLNGSLLGPAMDPITGVNGLRAGVLAPYWQPDMYQLMVRPDNTASSTNLMYPIDIWASPPPSPPTSASALPSPIFTPIAAGGADGFLWGLLPLTACKTLACANPDAAYWTGGFTGDRALPGMPFALAVKWLGSSPVNATIYVYASWAKYVNAPMPQRGGLVKLGTFLLKPDVWYLIVPGDAQPLPSANPCGYTRVAPGWLIAPDAAGVYGKVLFATSHGNASAFYYTTNAALNYTVSTVPAPNIVQPTVLFDSAVLMQNSNVSALPAWDARYFPEGYARMPWWPLRASEGRYGYWVATCAGGYSGYAGNLAPYQRLDISLQPGPPPLISAGVVRASVSPIVESYFVGGKGVYVLIRPNISGPLPPSAIRGYYLYFQRNGTWTLSGELRAGVYRCDFSPLRLPAGRSARDIESVVDSSCSYTAAEDGAVVIYMPASQAWDPATALPIWPWDPAMVVPDVRYADTIHGSGDVVAPSISTALFFNYWYRP